MPQYSIGAVSKLTNIPPHTLRKWESRHGIAVPLRSATGRRVYDEEQIETLRLVKRLLTAGHALSHLAALDAEALRDLAARHSEPERGDLTSITLVGPNLAHLLPNQRIVSHRFPGDLQEWLAQLPNDLGSEPVAVECETLPASLVDALVSLRARVGRLLAVYTFAPSHTLSALKQAGVEVARGPISDDELLLRLAPSANEPENESVPRQRFTTRELARVAALHPALRCECPKHIAKLLMDIASFEKYSTECSTAEPEAQALHAHLGEISARARVLFEDALIAVANADGIQLDTGD